MPVHSIDGQPEAPRWLSTVDADGLTPASPAARKTKILRVRNLKKPTTLRASGLDLAVGVKALLGQSSF